MRFCKEQAMELLSKYPKKDRVAEHYDEDIEFGAALRKLVGVDFEYPDFSHLTIEDCLKKVSQINQKTSQ